MPHAMADAISFLLANPSERKRLGRLAQARALEHFTEQQFLSSYEETYHKLVKRRRPEVRHTRCAIGN